MAPSFRLTPGACPRRRFILVRVERLELPRLAAPEPKSGVSTNFTIPAFRKPQRLIASTQESHGQSATNKPAPGSGRSRARRLYITRLQWIKGKMPISAGSCHIDDKYRPAISTAAPRKAAFHRLQSSGSASGHHHRHWPSPTARRHCAPLPAPALHPPAHNSARYRIRH